MAAQDVVTGAANGLFGGATGFFGGINANAVANFATIALVMIIFIVVALFCMWIIYENFVRYSIPVLVASTNQGGVNFLFDRGWMNIDKDSGRRVFRLKKGGIRLYNVEPRLHATSNGWIPLAQFGQTSYSPMKFEFNGDASLIAAMSGDSEWMNAAVKREIEKRKNQSWLAQNAGMLLGYGILIAIMIFLYLMLGKLDALHYLQGIGKDIGDGIATGVSTAKNLCSVQTISPITPAG